MKNIYHFDGSVRSAERIFHELLPVMQEVKSLKGITILYRDTTVTGDDQCDLSLSTTDGRFVIHGNATIIVVGEHIAVSTNPME